MGKGERAKQEHQEAQEQEKAQTVIYEFTVRVMGDGKIAVHGPIQDNPQMVMDVFGQALSSVARFQYQQKQKENRIIPATPGLVVPRH